MSTKIKNQLEDYKLSHNDIHRINVRRLNVHVNYIYRLERNYYCGCCGMLEYDIHYEEGTKPYEEEKERHMAIKRYLHFIVKTLKEKPDYHELAENHEKKMKRKENKSNKGALNKSKGKRRAEKRMKKERKKWLETQSRIEKQRKHSIYKVLKTIN